MKNKLLVSFLFFILPFALVSCTSAPAPKVLTFSEQIKVDTERAQSLATEFQKRVTFLALPRAEEYLNQLALRIAKAEPETLTRIVVRVHQDQKVELSRFFSFPGTLISIPASFLRKVEFENELAAAISFELSTVMKRTLASQVDANPEQTPILFGTKSIFNLNALNREPVISLGMKLLYYSGYDTRGMTSIFQRYPEYYVQAETSEKQKKEINLWRREAQSVKSNFLPTLNPIVRSDEFIKFKKDLKW